MKALFITTQTNDVDSVVSPWDSFNPRSGRITFNHNNPIDEEKILKEVKNYTPEVMFFIGSVGPNLPSHQMLRTLRNVSPLIHICFDGCDGDWPQILSTFKKHECFDLQVSIDGVKGNHVDLVTVAPVDSTFYDNPSFEGYDGGLPAREIRCGMSGNISARTEHISHQRARILWPLINSGFVILRKRITKDGILSYSDHIDFMKRCKLIINTSFAGSGLRHHLKQRVIESAFAGCGLLELEGSPIRDWFPEDCQFMYRDALDALRLIKSLKDEEIAECARKRQDYVWKHYTGKQIYESMLAMIEK